MPDPLPIDPTKNVLDLVEARAKASAELREADIRYFEARLTAAVKRLNDLYAQKAVFDGKQADTLRLQVDIVAAALGTRVTELERKQSESSGRGAGMATIIGGMLALGATIATAVGILLRAH
jgi:hydroxymethylpyrimidine/phosphomethylpyrimidine kinase